MFAKSMIALVYSDYFSLYANSNSKGIIGTGNS